MAGWRSKRTIVTLQEVINEVTQAGLDNEGSYSGDEDEKREEENDLFDDVPLQQESDEDTEVDEENNTDEKYTPDVSENDSDSDNNMINGNAVDAENVCYTLDYYFPALKS